MILKRVVYDDGSVRFEGGGFRLTNLHDVEPECFEHYCVVHWPNPTSVQNLEKWPHNWREDRGIMERICQHGVGHPDLDAAAWLDRHGHASQNDHGCDGCCAR